MKIIEFYTEQEAIDAMAIINGNMGYPIYENEKLIVDNWDIISKSINDTWIFLCPEDKYLVNVTNYITLNVTSDYFYVGPEEE